MIHWYYAGIAFLVGYVAFPLTWRRLRRLAGKEAVKAGTAIAGKP